MIDFSPYYGIINIVFCSILQVLQEVKMGIKRIFVTKKAGFDVEAKMLLADLKDNLMIKGLSDIILYNRYDILGLSDEDFNKAKDLVFSEPPVDILYEDNMPEHKNARIFASEYLPGQFDQRADSAAECVALISAKERPIVKVAKVYVLYGEISDEEFSRIKNYLINPIESREAKLDMPKTLEDELKEPEDVKVIDGFIGFNKDELSDLHKSLGLAMGMDDLEFLQGYFKDEEQRDPTITEIKVLDTYWSDHCRHTTFLTILDEVEFEEGYYTKKIKEVFEEYKRNKDKISQNKPICLMDIATIAAKELKKEGFIPDLDESEEINACSINIEVDIDGKKEDYLLMFKNETHNHPTEIEPFGGAATCLGGAIRDPLSGRSYVYQAMRVTGSGDPRKKVSETLPGKLPQKKITQTAAAGYSSYGNQVGLATGLVHEIYDEGYVAKRLEIGAVIGACPKENVIRKTPSPGDVVILIGGRTGRDGIGGATGSSKAHTDTSLETCGAEVQKGNPPIERKIQRLFRNKNVTRLIKKCNDFGAGGVSVAIGELADGLKINLDTIPKKYEGLDGTELAISESQERMAVVVDKLDADKFLKYVNEENLEGTIVAEVTKEPRLVMTWRGKTIVDISRVFLNSNGAKKHAKAKVCEPKEIIKRDIPSGNIKEKFIENLKDLNVASQQGLSERFDSSIGANTVLMPFGGKNQLTPIEAMAAKIPVLGGETSTASLMSFGFNVNISKNSPFHGAVYAIVESVSKIVASGGDYKKVRLTLQEYFERLKNEPSRWGKPLSALLGAYYAQKALKIPAIGGKDSMSGSFNDLDVPPTLVSFAVAVEDAKFIISPEFKKAGSNIVYIPVIKDEYDLPDFEKLEKIYSAIHKGIKEGKVLSASTVKEGGIAAAIAKMSFGNFIGAKISHDDLFTPNIGSFVLEAEDTGFLDDITYKILGKTWDRAEIELNGETIALNEALSAYEEPLSKVFPIKLPYKEEVPKISYEAKNILISTQKHARPRVFMPVFPGTNCEYDTERAFIKAGAEVDTFVIKNLTPKDIDQTLKEMAKRIRQSQIIMFPGGFSGGDEPDGSGKFIVATFQNPVVKEAVNDLLKVRDGLILGICNGFQALIKLGLVPYGEIRPLSPTSPTLTFNTIGRHISRICYTRIASNKSPWLASFKPGDVHAIPISHGEGRFVANEEWLKTLKENGQIATQYCNPDGEFDEYSNPNGSVWAIEGITSPCGRVLGKMAHSERYGGYVSKNIYGDKVQDIFKNGVLYFK